MFTLLPAPCSDENKMLFAAQQLRGTARLWWDHFHAMQPADHFVTWDEFWTTFREHHIPEGLIERKLNEFLNLTQEPAPLCNMHKFSTTCANMRDTMRTVMPAKEIVFTEA
jgi:hypothetical protein